MPRLMRRAAPASCFSPTVLQVSARQTVRSSAHRIRCDAIVDTSLPPLGGQVQSPLLQQPYTRQTNVGWVHQLDPATAVSVDVVRAEGRDVNTRLRINQLVNGRRYLAGLTLQPNSNQFRVALSNGTSEYNALLLS